MISLFKSSIYSYLLKSRKIASSLCLIDILKRLEKVPCQEQLSSIIKPHCGQLGAMHSFGPQIFSLWKKPLCYEEIMLLALPLAFILHSIKCRFYFYFTIAFHVIARSKIKIYLAKHVLFQVLGEKYMQ